jgi:hypothetical protein
MTIASVIDFATRILSYTGSGVTAIELEPGAYHALLKDKAALRAFDSCPTYGADTLTVYTPSGPVEIRPRARKASEKALCDYCQSAGTGDRCTYCGAPR